MNHTATILAAPALNSTHRVLRVWITVDVDVDVHTRYIPGAAAPGMYLRLYGLADHWSVKKPIDADLNLSSPDLKAFRDAESMTC